MAFNDFTLAGRLRRAVEKKREALEGFKVEAADLVDALNALEADIADHEIALAALVPAPVNAIYAPEPGTLIVAPRV